ncbi:Glypican-6 like protein [Argiope bruennichi]|uniref:Glypican-6 like protein n=1 Tax=Argiope bruennichi TaxID=94029 RepID=A0A8T0F2R4_ARGBR|nr:Glypican-6 like protein [Argiope bruennichi]
MKQILYSFLCISLLLIKVAAVKALSCSNVKYAYTTKGFDDGDVPKSAISGEHLRICERGLTCCTEEMEHKLSTHSRAEFDKLLHNTIGELKDIFETHTHRFDEFFRELLKVSRRGFHDMFVRTYGQLYEQNAYLFSSMFDDLEKYYATGDSLINLVSRLENSYNIESVLEPIDIKISESNHELQENGVAISKKLFHKCGKPRLGKRDLSDQEIPLEKLKFLHNHGARPTTAAGTSIERLVDNLKKKTKRIKKFWQELPLKMCSHSLMEEGSQGCWDGNAETKNVNASIKHLLPFKDSKEPNENPIINQQILTLNLISTKLSHAYKGLDVEWEDSADSSSGSGSGSGFGHIATAEDFEDLFFSVPRALPTDKKRQSSLHGEATSIMKCQWKLVELALFTPHYLLADKFFKLQLSYDTYSNRSDKKNSRRNNRLLAVSRRSINHFLSQ